MRVLLLITFLIMFSGVLSRSNAKALTESHGQEVIEMGSPVQGSNELNLTPDLEEEPSAEDDDDSKDPPSAAPRKNSTKRNPATESKKSEVKDNKLEDDESKIEKELGEVYKDSAEYGDDAVIAAATNDTGSEKEIARAAQFQFQPKSNNKEDIERFRTSIDEISCDRVTKKLYDVVILDNSKTNKPETAGDNEPPKPKAACTHVISFLTVVTTLSVLYTF